jgi:hypothetical protein
MGGCTLTTRPLEVCPRGGSLDQEPGGERGAPNIEEASKFAQEEAPSPDQELGGERGAPNIEEAGCPQEDSERSPRWSCCTAAEGTITPVVTARWKRP